MPPERPGLSLREVQELRQETRKLRDVLQVKNTPYEPAWYGSAWYDNQDLPIAPVGPPGVWQVSEPWTNSAGQSFAEKNRSEIGNCFSDKVDDCEASVTPPTTRQSTPSDSTQDDPFWIPSSDSLQDTSASDAEEFEDECKDTLAPLAKDRVSQKLKLADHSSFPPKVSTKQQQCSPEEDRTPATCTIDARPKDVPKAPPQKKPSPQMESKSPREQTNLSHQGPDPQSFALQQNMVSQPFMQAGPPIPPPMWSPFLGMPSTEVESMSSQAVPMMPPTMWNPFLGMHPNLLMAPPPPSEVPTAFKSQMLSNPQANGLIRHDETPLEPPVFHLSKGLMTVTEAQAIPPRCQEPPRRQEPPQCQDPPDCFARKIRFCLNCGEGVVSHMKFCGGCGTSIALMKQWVSVRQAGPVHVISAGEA